MSLCECVNVSAAECVSGESVSAYVSVCPRVSAYVSVSATNKQQQQKGNFNNSSNTVVVLAAAAATAEKKNQTNK